jgi:hypothetical protein
MRNRHWPQAHGWTRSSPDAALSFITTGNRLFMSTLIKIVLAVVLLVGVGGFVALASIDLTAPSKPVERVIPNDRFG